MASRWNERWYASKSRRGGYHREYRSRSRSFDSHRSRSPFYPKKYRRISTSPRYGRRPKPNNCIGVFGMSRHTDERELETFFSKYGDIEKINLVRDPEGNSRRFAFVYFRELDDAIEAVRRGNDQYLDDARIRVDFSLTNRPHLPTPGRYIRRYR
ncbi:TRA2B [Cordylochernes scorpioides]|uniref:TRA2B n=1 Tax=Cordylochernes scorpioides TaxID=51811 RepID=A0ABY6L576_9ARAC|nr:TRA2B [Cordylochernes scorpioides]